MSVAGQYEALRARYRTRLQSRIREQTLRSYDGQSIDANIGQYYVYGLPDGMKLVIHSYHRGSIHIIDEILQDDDTCELLLDRNRKLAKYASTGMDPGELNKDRVLACLADLRVVAVQSPGLADWHKKPNHPDRSPASYVRLRALLVEDQHDCCDVHMNEGILTYIGQTQTPEGRTVYQYTSQIGGFEIIRDAESQYRVRAYPTIRKLAERYAITDGDITRNAINRILSNGIDLATAEGDTHFFCFEEATASLNARFRTNTLNNWHVNDPYSVLDIKDGLRTKLIETQALVRHKGKHWLHDPDKIKSTGSCILWICERSFRSMGDVGAGFFRFLNTLWGPSYDAVKNTVKLRKRLRENRFLLDETVEPQFNMKRVAKVIHDRDASRFFNNLDFKNPETFTVDTAAALTTVQKSVQQAKAAINEFGSAAAYRGRDIMNPLSLLSKSYLQDPVALGVLDPESDFRDTTRCNREQIDRLRTMECLTDPLNPFLGGTCYVHDDEVITLQHGGLVRDFMPDGETVHIRFKPEWHDHELMPAMEAERGLILDGDGDVLVLKHAGRDQATGLPVFDREWRTLSESRREIARITGNESWRWSASREDTHATLAETADNPAGTAGV